MKVGDITRWHAITLEPGASVLEAAQIMRSEHVGDIIVVEKTDRGRIPLGILTDRDIVIGALAFGVTDLGKISVGDMMSRDLVTVRSDEGIFEAMEKMKQAHVRRAPVVNPLEVLVGIVTYDDLLAWLTERLAGFAKVGVGQRVTEFARRT